MHLVDDVHPVFADGRGEIGLVPQRPDVVYTVVGGGVHLGDVEDAPLFDPLADGTLQTGVAVHRAQAVDRLREDLRAGGLTGPAGAGEEVGVGHLALPHLVLEGAGDVLLGDHVGKAPRPPLAIECQITRSPPSGHRIPPAADAKSETGSIRNPEAVEKADSQNVKFGSGVKVTKKRAQIRSLGSSPF